MTTQTYRVRMGVVALLATMGSTVALAQPPFMRNMYTGPVVLPQVDPRAPVEDTIGLDDDWQRDRIESQNLPNPVPNTPETRAQGEQMYDV